MVYAVYNLISLFQNYKKHILVDKSFNKFEKMQCQLFTCWYMFTFTNLCMLIGLLVIGVNNGPLIRH